MSIKDYSTITELPNTEVTSTQLKRSFQRYCFAKKLSGNGRIVEIGCGGGQGLNLLLDISNDVIGYDIDQKNIDICKQNYKNEKRIKFIKADVENIEFEKNTIETILIFETIYYLKDQNKFFKKLHQSLKKNGKIIICSANKDWHSFNPSPFSTKYLSLKELHDFGKTHSFEVETFVSFPDRPDTLISKIINILKRFVVRFSLIPKTMKGKLVLKKLFSGRICIMPKKFTENTEEYLPPEKTKFLEKDIFSTAIFAVFTKK
jgi:ubiquinone/menaquinone biosynthesis C-methylase UbiE